MSQERLPEIDLLIRFRNLNSDQQVFFSKLINNLADARKSGDEKKMEQAKQQVKRVIEGAKERHQKMQETENNPIH